MSPERARDIGPLYQALSKQFDASGGRALLCRWLALCALWTAAGGMLSSCDTPVGVSPALQGTSRATSLVTNPDGGGPQVVRWGPPKGSQGGTEFVDRRMKRTTSASGLRILGQIADPEAYEVYL